jgi:hypothetical protein
MELVVLFMIQVVKIPICVTVHSDSMNLNANMTLPARATVVQLYNYHHRSCMLLIEHQQIYNGLPSSIRYYHRDTDAPTVEVLKIYENLSHPHYFLMYFLNRQKINITSFLAYCPHASLLLSES